MKRKVPYLIVVLSAIIILTSCREGNNSVIAPQDEITSYVPINTFVTSPEQHQLWEQGNNYSITWNPIDEGNVKIELLKKNQVRYVISTNTPNDGEINWSIPRSIISSDMYYIKITKIEDNNFIYVSGLFSIKDY